VRQKVNSGWVECDAQGVPVCSGRGDFLKPGDADVVKCARCECLAHAFPPCAKEAKVAGVRLFLCMPCLTKAQISRYGPRRIEGSGLDWRELVSGFPVYVMYSQGQPVCAACGESLSRKSADKIVCDACGCVVHVTCARDGNVIDRNLPEANFWTCAACRSPD
jgi:hypothetical protein